MVGKVQPSVSISDRVANPVDIIVVKEGHKHFLWKDVFNVFGLTTQQLSVNSVYETKQTHVSGQIKFVKSFKAVCLGLISRKIIVDQNFTNTSYLLINQKELENQII